MRKTGRVRHLRALRSGLKELSNHGFRSVRLLILFQLLGVPTLTTLTGLAIGTILVGFLVGVALGGSGAALVTFLWFVKRREMVDAGFVW